MSVLRCQSCAHDHVDPVCVNRCEGCGQTGTLRAVDPFAEVQNAISAIRQDMARSNMEIQAAVSALREEIRVALDMTEALAEPVS